MADKKYRLDFKLSNGSTESVQFTAPQGEKGDPGAAGKSAYAYAQDGGYTGTEAEFATKLAKDLTFEVTVTQNANGSYTSSHDPATISQAAKAGKIVTCRLTMEAGQLAGDKIFHMVRPGNGGNQASVLFVHASGNKIETIQIRRVFTSEQVTVAEYNLATEEYVDSKAGSGGVSSWNDLTDKPFGEPEIVELLPKTQFVYESSAGFFVTPGVIDFQLGKPYIVNWNGTDYNTEGVHAEYLGNTIVGIGNLAALGGENNGLPFGIACFDGLIGAIPLDGSTAVEASISETRMSTIDEEFLPEHLRFVDGEMYEELYPKTQFIYESSIDAYFAPVADILRDGETYIVNWNGVDYTTQCYIETGSNLHAIGNPAGSRSGGGDDNGLPFTIFTWGDYFAAIPLDGSTSVEVSIGRTTGVKQIESKHLPKPLQFGEKTSVLFPKTQFTYDSGMGLFVAPGADILREAETYTVNWNGVDYAATCFMVPYNGVVIPAMGNLAALGGENNGLPFGIAYMDGSFGAIPMDGSTSIEVEISVTVVKKIEEKYVPEVGMPFYIPLVLEGSDKYTTTMTYYEVVKAHNAGRMIYLKQIDKSTSLNGEHPYELVPMARYQFGYVLIFKTFEDNFLVEYTLEMNANLGYDVDRYKRNIIG